jgi:hypothetical protein
MEIVGCLSVSLETFVESLLTRNVLTEYLSRNGLFRIYSLQRERVFGELLASNGLLLWLHCSGCQASCHNMILFVNVLDSTVIDSEMSASVKTPFA